MGFSGGLRRWLGRRRVWLVLGIAALFSGVALLGYLLAGLALPLTLAFTGMLLVVTVVLIWRRSDSATRGLMKSVVLRGALVALVAVAVYDVSREILAQLDPSPFNPFGAIPIFGHLLLGAEASAEAALVAGIGFHLLNGVSFGLAYAFVFGPLAVRSLRMALLTGMGWGLFLELFQLTLYPGWLNIETYREFVTISFLGHFAYGATLGALGHRFLPWARNEDLGGDADDDDGDEIDDDGAVVAR